MNKKELSNYMSKIAKNGHKKSPRPIEFYRENAYKSHEARKKNKLSTVVDIETC